MSANWYQFHCRLLLAAIARPGNAPNKRRDAGILTGIETKNAGKTWEQKIWWRIVP
jgi:hypothetical protein